jgi:predicted NAD/FAD-binding protein
MIQNANRKTRSKVAVIGSGISGLSATYLLQRQHEVHIFEADNRLGGHSNTVFVGPQQTAVDTGFIVFNELNYPNLSGLFRHLDVETCDSEMSLSVKFRDPDLEWGGATLSTLVAQRRNLVRPQFWSMVKEILRFNRDSVINQERSRLGNWSLRELLSEQKYKKSFIDWYLVPMGAAIWSTPSDTMLDFPAETFLQFCLNHRLLQVNERPVWKTVRGGSIQYVRKLAATFKNIHSGHAVERVVRKRDGGVEVHCNGQVRDFDAVIFATHPPETLRMLAEQSSAERRVLESFGFQKNIARLHSDESFLPSRRSLWSAWNFHQQREDRTDSPVSLSYWMNRLQPLSTERNLILSLNTDSMPSQLHREIEYHHPVFDRRAIDSQKKLDEIQGLGSIYHCGAWTRYGFHEDGILSAVNLAKSWGLTIPWEKPQVVSLERQREVS